MIAMLVQKLRKTRAAAEVFQTHDDAKQRFIDMQGPDGGVPACGYPKFDEVIANHNENLAALGDVLAAAVQDTLTAPFVSALQVFMDTCSEVTLRSAVATDLSCSEAESLAALFVACGDVDTGRRWIEAHAQADGCGDWHCGCARCQEAATNPCTCPRSGYELCEAIRHHDDPPVIEWPAE